MSKQLEGIKDLFSTPTMACQLSLLQ